MSLPLPSFSSSWLYIWGASPETPRLTSLLLRWVEFVQSKYVWSDHRTWQWRSGNPCLSNKVVVSSLLLAQVGKSPKHRLASVSFEFWYFWVWVLVLTLLLIKILHIMQLLHICAILFVIPKVCLNSPNNWSSSKQQHPGNNNNNDLVKTITITW